jgi:hypothetical protein
VPPAETQETAGRTDVPPAGVPPGWSSIRSTDNEEPVTKNLSLAARAAIRAAVPDATDDETDAFARQVQQDHNPDNLARYVAAFPAARITAAIADIRRARKGVNLSAVPSSDRVGLAIGASTPTPARYAEMCAWCSRPGHDRDGCPERAALSRGPDGGPVPATAPVRAVDQVDGRGEFARRLAAMKARHTERVQGPAGPVYPDESRDVLPDDYGDGDHAA